ncbi:MAG: hypothetical protein IKC27_09065 [Kiritimatiellae bacterium]|nr:hypothetical protein [Kiritimatiellia bacterium]
MIEKFAEAWNQGLVVFGLFTIFLCLIALFGFYFYQKLKKQTDNRFVASVVVAAFACLAFTAYPTSSEKNPEGRKDPISFLQTNTETKYLIDKGSWVSNNVVHLEFETRLLPQSAELFLDYIPKSEPADSTAYSTYYRGTVDNTPSTMEFEFENAISNRWIFYTTYVPGPNVHTNGVAVAEFIKATKYDNVAVPKRSTIWENGKRIWPSDEKYDLLNQLGEETGDDVD